MAAINKGVVKVGDADYRWSVFRQPRWSTGRTHGYTLLGLAILVEPPEPSRRDLLLEFGIDPKHHGDMPQHQRFLVPDGRLVEAIECAMRAGYDPDSRGKRFVYEAAKTATCVFAGNSNSSSSKNKSRLSSSNSCFIS